MIIITPVTTTPQPIDQLITFTATANGGAGGLQYKWLFGDNTPETAYSTSSTISHSFQNPGRYIVTLTVTDNSGQEVSEQFYQAIHTPFTSNRPAISMSVVYESRAGNDRIWNVNPDNDTVSVFDVVTNNKLAEVAVGDEPRSLAIAPDGRVWVTNHGSDTLNIINEGSLTVEDIVSLPSGSRPFGLVFDPNGSSGFVALQATGLLVKLNPSNGTQTGSVNVGPHPRHISVDDTGNKVYVSRFITPRLPGEATPNPQTSGVGGEVIIVNTVNMSLIKTVVLEVNNSSDFEAGARGVPNYIGAPVISPDGLTAWIPSKQDNVFRGSLRDGNNLNFEHTVRAISSYINLSNDTEDFLARLDHDNSSLGSAGTFGFYGNYYFVALESSREIAVIDTHQRTELFRFDVGRAPQGLTTSSDGLTLYVHNFMDRSVSSYDLSQLVNAGLLTINSIATYNTVANETLPSPIFLGKQHFYDAKDTRLAQDGYMSCAVCHNDGDHDGRVWDLTGFGEGLRNTISLNGGGGSQDGRLHWTSNFDEVQDFEGQIRNLAGGTGLMNDSDFIVTTDPLGTPKTGLSAALDALAAYVDSLTSFGNSPNRASDGSLTSDGIAGRAIFESNGCGTCHSGERYTDSASNTLHDIGTITPNSGNRLGGPLIGIDTPTLRGLWKTAPYLHDGSAGNLSEAITAHNNVSMSSTELNQLVAFLEQIDDNEPPPSSNQNTPPVITNPGNQIYNEGQNVSLPVTASDIDGDVLTHSASSLPTGLSINISTGLISGIASPPGAYSVTVSADDGQGGTHQVTFNLTVNLIGSTTLAFEHGVGGYASTIDTYVQADPAFSDRNNSEQVEINIDADSPFGSGNAVQALLQFDEIFGNGNGQIPIGSEILSATLSLELTNAGDSFAVHRMVQPWVESVTWNSLNGGVQSDDIEAFSTPDFTTGPVGIGTLPLDVTSSLDVWVTNPSVNQGWVFLPTGNNGVDFWSSEGVTPPKLVVQFVPPGGGGNANPIVNSDNYSTPQDSTLGEPALTGVLANDSDPDGDPLTVNPTPVNGPSNGTLALATDGGFTYVPTGGFTGPDSFVYEVNDGQGGTAQGTVSLTVTETTAAVSPVAETTPVPSAGDAADDPAIWVHPQTPAQSLIIGTDKLSGIATYDLSGTQQQFLADGQINNVDLRYGFVLNGTLTDLVAGSNRSNDSLVVYQVNQSTGQLTNVAVGGGIPTNQTQTLGLCMYRSAVSGKFYAFVTTKTGEIMQWELIDNGSGLVTGTAVRTLNLGTETEGCVADDELGTLYVGEEGAGIWQYGAEPSAGSTRSQIDTTGPTGHLTADVEGLGLYVASNGTGYLLASSQGNSAYVLYEA